MTMIQLGTLAYLVILFCGLLAIIGVLADALFDTSFIMDNIGWVFTPMVIALIVFMGAMTVDILR